MRVLSITRWPALAAVAVVALLPGAAAAAAGSEGPDADEEAAVTWSVRPADADGADGRSWAELELDPGESVTESLELRNFGEQDVEFALHAADGYFTDTGRFTILPTSETSEAAGTWIELEQETVRVPAEGRAVVDYTVTVPEDTTPGDHPAGVAAAIGSQGTDADGNVVDVQSRVGFRVMTRVTGEVAPALDVAVSGDYRLDWNPFRPGTMDIAYTVTNTGNVRLGADTAIRLGGLGGDTDQPGIAIEEIAPGETRSGTAELRGVWPIGPLTASLEASGRAVTADDGVTAPEPVTASDRLIAVPLPQLILLLVAVALAALWLRQRRAQRRELDRRLEEARAQGRAEAENRADPARTG